MNDVERQGCQEEAASNPQLIFANCQAAISMCCAYYAWSEGKIKGDFNYVMFDTLTLNQRNDNTLLLPKSKK
jgi:hypothetical protein